MAANAMMSCGVAAVCPSVLSSSKSKFAASVNFGTNATTSRFTMSAEWMPASPVRPTSTAQLRARDPCTGGIGPGQLGQGQEWAAVPGGQATYLGNPVPWGTLPTILVIEFLAIAFVEHQRSMEKDPEKKKYPGRLALLAFVGFCVQQSAYPGTGPLENLATHLADPWHNNIGSVLIPPSVLP
ncbi:hypothetical protein DH2020_030052 [Rehmannia glutinosa]|uniref:Chlorophyll a-b binding protein, chloroplastic n=1 Tax=Rehmannia glutinosa TaxID=99300 RepID=A0ABR0VLV4_REHGL